MKAQTQLRWYIVPIFIFMECKLLAGGSRPLLGDTLVIAGTIFFAMSNVGEEFFVKKKDLVEVVSMIGLFGMLYFAYKSYSVPGHSTFGYKALWKAASLKLKGSLSPKDKKEPNHQFLFRFTVCHGGSFCDVVDIALT
ncbi:hypothetical protein RJ639_004130 [Escallonia herrerae]|uniref:Uncharacterized protein n=1 Tax=Escallonia herrerae TaxID=1293975 RepID=A0AA88W888_9ASTE|nr:hypothetical protein RJ639_004130 [Escallonia herrerae]